MLAALAAVVFSLPVAATWHPSVPVELRIASLGVLAVSIVRPFNGLLILAGVLPLAMLVGAVADAPFGTTEVMELLIAPVGLSCAIRELSARRSGEDGRLLWPSVVLIALVLASLMVQLAVQRGNASALGSWADDIWRHVSRTYFADGPIYPPLHRALGWIWGLALAVFAERRLRDSPAHRLAVVRMFVLGAAASGLFALVRVAEVALRSGRPWQAVWDVFEAIRISPHMDPNAAGSFYVMAAVPALWWAISTRAWWAILSVPPIVGALWLTRSRTAFIVFVVALGFAWVWSRQWSWRRGAVATLAGAAALALLIAIGFGRSQAAEPAMRFRLDMALVSARLAARHPIFGIGLDEFQAASVPLMTPEAIVRFPPAARGENAHNNFLQILVELGAAGLAAFLWLVFGPGLAFARALRGSLVSSESAGLAGGVCAFLLSCLAGHPLMVPQAALPFFLALGLLAASLPAVATRRGSMERRVAAVAIAAIAVALIFRLPTTI
jgi:hypothetical protein